MNAEELLLRSLRYRFREIKRTGDGALAQVDESDLHWRINPEVNSIAILVQHLHGNMLSRWTDFFTADGNKPWRDRDGEFEAKQANRAEIVALREEGGERAFTIIDALTNEDLTRCVKIRGQELDVIDSCLRQLGYYASHVGQIVHIAKERLGNQWQTLSIARGKSREYKPQRKD
jgi:hypothetical protein